MKKFLIAVVMALGPGVVYARPSASEVFCQMAGAVGPIHSEFHSPYSKYVSNTLGNGSPDEAGLYKGHFSCDSVGAKPGVVLFRQFHVRTNARDVYENLFSMREVESFLERLHPSYPLYNFNEREIQIAQTDEPDRLKMTMSWKTQTVLESKPGRSVYEGRSCWPDARYISGEYCQYYSRYEAGDKTSLWQKHVVEADLHTID